MINKWLHMLRCQSERPSNNPPTQPDLLHCIASPRWLKNLRTQVETWDLIVASGHVHIDEWIPHLRICFVNEDHVVNLWHSFIYNLLFWSYFTIAPLHTFLRCIHTAVTEMSKKYLFTSSLILNTIFKYTIFTNIHKFGQEVEYFLSKIDPHKLYEP